MNIPMSLGSNIIIYTFTALGILIVLWNILGFIPGLIFIIQSVKTSDKQLKKQKIKKVLICFGGILLIIFTYILYFLVGLISSFSKSPYIIQPK